MLSAIINFFRAKLVRENLFIPVDYYPIIRRSGAKPTRERYLALKSKFAPWEAMTVGKRQAQVDMVECRNAENSKDDGLQTDETGYTFTLVTIPDCNFDCGSAPCTCSRDWCDYRELVEIYDVSRETGIEK